LAEVCIQTRALFICRCVIIERVPALGEPHSSHDMSVILKASSVLAIGLSLEVL
jgi:hypothetical protein